MSRWISIALVLLLPTDSFGTENSSWKLTVRALSGATLGNTVYGLELTGYDPNMQTEITAESELEFPVDFFVSGLEIGFEFPLSETHTLSLVVSGATNLHDPFGLFRDSDYLTVPEMGVERTKFLYSESITTARAVIGELRGGMSLVRFGSESYLSILAGYRHEYYLFHGYGAEGWRLDENNNRVFGSIDDSTEVIHYETNHLLPYAGVGIFWKASKYFVLEYETRLLAAFSLDYDDHVLRGKDLHGRAAGVGVLVGVAPRMEFALQEGVSEFSAGLNLELEYLYARFGRLQQEYYADDPGIPGDQTLEKIPDSDFFVTSLKVGAWLLVGISF